MQDTDDININALLAERKQIMAIWRIEDVKTIRPDLTDAQASEVFQEVDRDHDAEGGIAWATLEDAANHRFENPPEEGE